MRDYFVSLLRVSRALRVFIYKGWKKSVTTWKTLPAVLPAYRFRFDLFRFLKTASFRIFRIPVVFSSFWVLSPYFRVSGRVSTECPVFAFWGPSERVWPPRGPGIPGLLERSPEALKCDMQWVLSKNNWPTFRRADYLIRLRVTYHNKSMTSGVLFVHFVDCRRAASTWDLW